MNVLIKQSAMPVDLRFESEHYWLRTLTPEDASQRACAWFADPAKARMVNLPPRALSLAAFKDYISSHDRVSGHVLGIFDKVSGAHIGLWSVYIDWELKEFLVNVLVGERGYEPGARRETQRVLVEYLFQDLDLELLRCSVLTRNSRIAGRLEDAGILSEHTSFKPSAVEEAFEEIQHYSVPRDAWLGFRNTRDRRDQVLAALDAAGAGI